MQLSDREIALLLPSLAHGEQATIKQIQTGLDEGVYFKFAGHDAVAIAQIDSFEGRLVLFIFCAGGALSSLQALAKDIEQYAAENGFYKVQMLTRKGFGRALNGYKVTMELMEKCFG